VKSNLHLRGMVAGKQEILSFDMVHSVTQHSQIDMNGVGFLTLVVHFGRDHIPVAPRQSPGFDALANQSTGLNS
jgi:hypothetical protein